MDSNGLKPLLCYVWNYFSIISCIQEKNIIQEKNLISTAQLNSLCLNLTTLACKTQKPHKEAVAPAGVCALRPRLQFLGLY